MSSTVKEYVNHAVQTTFSPPSSPCLSSVQALSDFSRIDAPSSSLGILQSSPEISCDFDGSFVSLTSSPARSITTCRRAIKPQRIPPQFPSQISQSDKQRIISLPETISLFSAKSQLDSVTQRMVSMPENLKSLVHAKDFVLYISEYDELSMTTGGSALSTDGARFCEEIGPRTPSPPSSPESVVIIQNQYQLSETFLRNSKVGREINGTTEREGWVTWAKSPPRPIPALHGPLSLPYARCPSGAEGTVIDEQENLPGMIWGLASDASGGKAEGAKTTLYQDPAFASHIAPRFQKSDSVDRNPASHPPAPETKPRPVKTEREFEYPSQFHQPIDISLLRVPPLSPSLGRPGVRAKATGTRRIPDENSLDNQRLEFNSSVGNKTRAVKNTPSNVRSNQPAANRPVADSMRPFLHLRSQPLSLALPHSHRLSTLEMARDCQYQQSPNPNSSHPLSCPSTSLQNAGLSPEAVFFASLPLDAQQDIADRLRRSVHEHRMNPMDNTHHESEARLQWGPIADSMRPNTLRDGHFHATPNTSQYRPSPPPDGPLPPVPSARYSDVEYRRPPPSISEINAPLPFSTARPPHQIRSGMLNRAVQMRLPAVPEISEEQQSFYRSVSPPIFQQNFHMSRPPVSNVEKELSYQGFSGHQTAHSRNKPSEIAGPKNYARRSSAFEQIKAQLYGPDHVDFQEDGPQTEEFSEVIPVVKPSNPTPKRKFRAKKKNGGNNRNSAVKV